MTEPVAFVDLAAMHDEVAAEIADGFSRVLRSCAFAGGPDIGLFEQEFAAASAMRHCVGVANGTDAIELALRALGVGPGDEVVVPANTFVATVEAVLRSGAQVVLADVDPDTLLVDVESMGRAIGPRTAALVPVHLYGQMAAVEQTQAIAARHGLVVVEDAAQAQGATRFGHGIGHGSAAATTSFYPGKNLGAYGDAGAVVTDDGELAGAIRMLGNHGSRQKYVHETLGFNSRLDTLQAVVLRAKLPRLQGWNERRRQAAQRYLEAFEGTPVRCLRIAEGNVAVWHLFVVRVDSRVRDDVLLALEAARIGAGIHYPLPVHRHQAYSHLGVGGDFPVSEGAASQMLSLPMHPALTAAQQDRVVETVLGVVGR